MTRERLTEYGVTLLRVSLGVMYLAHSILLKLFTFGLAGTAGYFESIGLPGWLAYVTFAAEAVGGAMLVLGIYARWVVLALIPALLGAIHGGNGWVFNAPNGCRSPNSCLARVAVRSAPPPPFTDLPKEISSCPTQS